MALKNFFAVFLFSLLMAGFAFAAPEIPHQFYGTVTINGNPANNAGIVAKINNVEVATTVSTNGTYGYYPNIFYVPDPNPNAKNGGETIEFYLNNNKVAEGKFQSGGYAQLDLNYGAATFCGDGQCNSNENSSNCPADCGTVQPPANNPPPGPIGGGGVSSGGSGEGSLLIQIIGRCVSQPISVGVVNINGNPVASPEIEVVHNRTSVAKKIAGADGNTSFSFDEIGKYEFVARKGIAVSSLKIITLVECETPKETPAETTATVDLCKEKNCNDSNPCTQDSCSKGVCNYRQLEGISCGENKVCKAGACASTLAESPNVPQGDGATGFFTVGTLQSPFVIGAVLAIIAIILGFAFWKKTRK